MANSQYEVLEFRAIIKPEWTELYILCGPPTDGPIGVQGWHKGIIPKDMPAIEALRSALLSREYLVGQNWSQGAPPG